MITPLGRVGDIYGRSWIFSAGFAIFIIGSALCGLSPQHLLPDRLQGRASHLRDGDVYVLPCQQQRDNGPRWDRPLQQCLGYPQDRPEHRDARELCPGHIRGCGLDPPPDRLQDFHWHLKSRRWDCPELHYQH